MKALLMALALLIATSGFAADKDRTVKKVQLKRGSESITLTGHIKGYHYIDYQVRAAAGQTLKARMTTAHRAAYFNLLPPGSVDVAMYIGNNRIAQIHSPEDFSFCRH